MRLLRTPRHYLLWSAPLVPARWRDTRVWVLGRLSLWRLPAWRKDYARRNRKEDARDRAA